METKTLDSIQNACTPQHQLASLDWQPVLDLLRSPAAQALRVERLLLFEISRDGEGIPLLVLRAATTVPPQETLVGLDDATLTALDRTDNGPFAFDAARPGGDLAPLFAYMARQEVTSALLAPVYHEERLWGCLAACAGERRSFSPAEQVTFSLITSSVALAVENARLRAETGFRFSEAMSLETVSSALVERRSLDGILAVIIDEAVRLLHAGDALVLLLEEGGERFEVRARKGRDVAGLTSGRLSVRDSLNGLVVQTGEPLVSNDVLNDPQANRARAQRLNVHTVAIAPLIIRQRTIGTIAVHNKRDGFFSQTDVGVLCSFANQAAVAIDNARLFGELVAARDEIQQKAQELQALLIETMNIQEDERQRIAADLHDRVVSRLVGALYQVETCRQRHSQGGDFEEPLDLLQQLLDEVVERTRTSIYDLWPATLEHMGLLPALRELCSDHERRGGLRPTMRVTGSAYELRAPVRITAYRIVQEALSNIRQHAAANRVELGIRFSPRWLRIVIRDDGSGFDVQSVMLSPPRLHFGLIGMRERAESVGGHLRVHSAPGGGTEIVLELPHEGAGLPEKKPWNHAADPRIDR